MNLTDNFQRAESPLRAVIEAVPATRWGSPSPCDGWTATDVVGHLIDSQRNFLAGKDVELPEVPPVDADPAAAWAAHAALVEALVADEDLMATAYDGHFGPTTVGETVRDFHIFDMVAHRWDLAVATGQVTQFSDAELDQLDSGMDAFGEALYMPGVAKAGVEAPDGGTRQQKVLARLGRQA